MSHDFPRREWKRRRKNLASCDFSVLPRKPVYRGLIHTTMRVPNGFCAWGLYEHRKRTGKFPAAGMALAAGKWCTTESSLPGGWGEELSIPSKPLQPCSAYSQRCPFYAMWQRQWVLKEPLSEHQRQPGKMAKGCWAACSWYWSVTSRKEQNWGFSPNREGEWEGGVFLMPLTFQGFQCFYLTLFWRNQQNLTSEEAMDFRLLNKIRLNV